MICHIHGGFACQRRIASAQIDMRQLMHEGEPGIASYKLTLGVEEIESACDCQIDENVRIDWATPNRSSGLAR
jgi:hypothetical protein